MENKTIMKKFFRIFIIFLFITTLVVLLAGIQTATNITTPTGSDYYVFPHISGGKVTGMDTFAFLGMMLTFIVVEIITISFLWCDLKIITSKN